jgi:hypothetical protein
VFDSVDEVWYRQLAATVFSGEEIPEIRGLVFGYASDHLGASPPDPISFAMFASQ